MATLTVTMGCRAYVMTAGQAESMLAVASTCVPHGIYAVKRGGHIEMRNDPMSPAEVPAAVERWRADGYEVRYNA